ncbi:hypothetical protein [Halarcobacter anaerophilus]|uniref:Uncharacterized protein n=1 Tax=Halarcobacter anaerophilus TaxID=877500 RepID=A0A4Q0Y2J6_9BACT|nr:hypothetical protein [Halarcobacter anaerophilus]RXJ63715.1 hypothetical protein CRV06_05875 [Halarcobacter anaerophilus]
MFDFEYSFHWLTVWHVFPEMLSAALVTIQVAVLSMIFGLIVAIFLVFISTNKKLKKEKNGYIK